MSLISIIFTLSVLSPALHLQAAEAFETAQAERRDAPLMQDIWTGNVDGIVYQLSTGVSIFDPSLSRLGTIDAVTMALGHKAWGSPSQHVEQVKALILTHVDPTSGDNALTRATKNQDRQRIQQLLAEPTVSRQAPQPLDLISQQKDTKIEWLTRRLVETTTQVQSLQDQVHIPDQFRTPSDPAMPDVFATKLEIVFREARQLVMSIVRTGTLDKEIKKQMAKRLLQTLNSSASEETCEKYIETDSNFLKATLVAFFTKELFKGFADNAFDVDVTSIPGSPHYQDRKLARHESKKRFDQMSAWSGADLLKQDEDFKIWHHSVKTRIAKTWKETGLPELTPLDWEALPEGDIRNGFLALCKHIWGLHKLARAYPAQPELIRFASNSPVRTDYATSHYHTEYVEEKELEPVSHEELSHYRVLFQVFPGFQLDSKKMSADVYYDFANP